MLTKELQVNGKITHQACLQAVIIEMVHMWHVRSYAFYILGSIKPIDCSLSSGVACGIKPGKNKTSPFDDWAWVKLVFRELHDTCRVSMTYRWSFSLDIYLLQQCIKIHSLTCRQEFSQQRATDDCVQIVILWEHCQPARNSN